jgi:hypothetical protein
MVYPTATDLLLICGPLGSSIAKVVNRGASWLAAQAYPSATDLLWIVIVALLLFGAGELAKILKWGP